MTSKTQGIELKIDKLDFIKFKFIYVSKDSLKKVKTGTSLVVQWLGLHTSPAGDTGSIPGQETKMPTYHDVQLKKKS